MLQHKETIKTITLTLLIGLIAGFVIGVQAQSNQTNAINASVKTIQTSK